MNKSVKFGLKEKKTILFIYYYYYPFLEKKKKRKIDCISDSHFTVRAVLDPSQ
jgi:hypothetical protein